MGCRVWHSGHRCRVQDYGLGARLKFWDLGYILGPKALNRKLAKGDIFSCGPHNMGPYDLGVKYGDATVINALQTSVHPLEAPGGFWRLGSLR